MESRTSDIQKGFTTKIHLVFASAKAAMIFNLSVSQKHDAPQGRKLMESVYSDGNHYFVMDRTYEDDRGRTLAVQKGFIPVVPPKKNRKELWNYDKKIYRCRNEIERYFLRIKRFRKVFTHYDKLDVIYSSVVSLAMIFDAILM